MKTAVSDIRWPGVHERPIVVRLLGACRLWVSGSPVTQDQWKYRKLEAIFQYLAAHAGTNIPGDRLIEEFWPEMEEERARQNLSVALYNLRRLLEPDLEKASQSRYITYRGGRCRFDVGGCFIDRDEFVRLLSFGSRLARGDNHEAAKKTLQQAVRLYGGDFLGDSLDSAGSSEWALVERERLREAYLDTCRWLAEAAAEDEDPAEAIHYYRRILTDDPLREDIHLALMRVLYAAGRRVDAIHQYHELREVLDEELGVTPMEEIRQFYDEVIS